MARWLKEKIHIRAFCSGNPVTEEERVCIFGPIDTAMADRVCLQLHDAGPSKLLRIEIDSVGGDFDAALRIYMGLRKFPALAKEAVMLRECCSGAVLIAAAADLRMACNETYICIHAAAYPGTNKRLTRTELLRSAAELRRSDELMFNVLAQRTGASFAEVCREAGDEYPSSMEWLTANGFVHRLVGVVS